MPFRSLVLIFKPGDSGDSLGQVGFPPKWDWLGGPAG